MCMNIDEFRMFAQPAVREAGPVSSPQVAKDISLGHGDRFESFRYTLIVT